MMRCIGISSGPFNDALLRVHEVPSVNQREHPLRFIQYSRGIAFEPIPFRFPFLKSSFECQDVLVSRPHQFIGRGNGIHGFFIEPINNDLLSFFRSDPGNVVQKYNLKHAGVFRGRDMYLFKMIIREGVYKNEACTLLHFSVKFLLRDTCKVLFVAHFCVPFRRLMP